MDMQCLKMNEHSILNALICTCIWSLIVKIKWEVGISQYLCNMLWFVVQTFILASKTKKHVHP